MGPILFLDNATIHTNELVAKTLKKNKLQAVTNCPYAPELNAAEYFIRSHKRILSQELSELR